MTTQTPVKSGRFSSGNERWPDAPAKQRVGSFADGYTTWEDTSGNGRRLALAARRSPARIDPRSTLADPRDIRDSTGSLAELATELYTVATRLEDDEADRGPVDLVVSSLTDVEQGLRDFSGAVERAGDALIPPAGIGENVSRRYARATAAWPRVGDSAPPSHERQAQIRSAIHDAAATLRAGAECCRRARDIVRSTVA